MQILIFDKFSTRNDEIRSEKLTLPRFPYHKKLVLFAPHSLVVAGRQRVEQSSKAAKLKVVVSHSFAAGGGWTGRRLYRPTGFLDPRNGSNRGGRESGGEGSVTGTGSLPTRFLRFLYRTGEQVRPPLSFFFANRFENRDAPREKRGARINRFFDFSATNGPNATRKREGGGGEDSLLVCIERERAKAVGPSIKRYLAARGRVLCLVPPPRAELQHAEGENRGEKKKERLFVCFVRAKLLPYRCLICKL